MKQEIRRGNVFLAHLGQTQGQEQGGKRPCLIVSDDIYNKNSAGLVFILPITSREWELPWHVEVAPPEGGLDRRSFVMCDQLRAITTARLFHYFGDLSDDTMRVISDRLRVLFHLAP